MKVAVISACYGGYDVPKPPVLQDTEHEVTFTMVTDGPEWDGWNTIVEPRLHLHNNVAAKVPKCRPDLYAARDVAYTIWVDAGATFGPGMVEAILGVFRTTQALVLSIPHPPSHSITDEVVGSRGLRKYDPLPLEQQVSHYLATGYPSTGIVWTTGVLGRTATQDVITVGNMWLAEIARWGFQDQLSYTYVLRKAGIIPAALPKELLYFFPHMHNTF